MLARSDIDKRCLDDYLPVSAMLSGAIDGQSKDFYVEAS